MPTNQDPNIIHEIMIAGGFERAENEEAGYYQVKGFDGNAWWPKTAKQAIDIIMYWRWKLKKSNLKRDVFWLIDEMESHTKEDLEKLKQNIKNL